MTEYKNIALTGARQAGKSTLANRLLEGLPHAGFRTTVYARTAAGPLYQLTDILTGQATPISRLTQEGIRGIPEAFENAGVNCLEKALLRQASVVLLDEIGRFERNSPAFLRAVDRVLDSPKRVIAVLKKEQLDHIAAISARKDTLVVDLDVCGREAAWKIADQWLQNL